MYVAFDSIQGAWSGQELSIICLLLFPCAIKSFRPFPLCKFNGWANTNDLSLHVNLFQHYLSVNASSLNSSITSFVILPIPLRMLPVYLESNFIKTISDEQLPTDVAQLQKYILSTLSVDSCSHVDIYDITGQRVIQGEIEPIWLSYAVVSLTAEAAIKWKPVKVTLRQTDKTGHLLFKHPTTSIAELKRTIESLTGVPIEQQALFYGGSPLEDTCSTIEQVGLRQSSMVHLLDLRKLPTGLGEYFMVNLQPAQSGLQSYEIEVSSGFDVRRLKECASELFQIPLQDLLLTYCGMILGRNDATLLEYKLVPGAFVNAINEKKSFKPRNEGQTI